MAQEDGGDDDDIDDDDVCVTRARYERGCTGGQLVLFQHLPASQKGRAGSWCWLCFRRHLFTPALNTVLTVIACCVTSCSC